MVNDINKMEEFKKVLENEKGQNNKIGFTNGCFDILHLGHVRYLQSAKDQCDILVIGVNSDSSVKRLKGPSRPVNPQNSRMEVLSAIGCVDYVVLFDEDTPENLIKALSPDVIFKGGDWKEEDVVGGEYVKSYGGKVSIINYEKGHSTTDIIGKIQKEEK